MDRKEKKALNNATYRASHREELLEKKKIYRQIQIMCSCGREVTRNHVSEHLQTKKHHKLVEKEIQDRKELLEDKTNVDSTKLILSFL